MSAMPVVSYQIKNKQFVVWHGDKKVNMLLIRHTDRMKK